MSAFSGFAVLALLINPMEGADFDPYMSATCVGPAGLLGAGTAVSYRSHPPVAPRSLSQDAYSAFPPMVSSHGTLPNFST